MQNAECKMQNEGEATLPNIVMASRRFIISSLLSILYSLKIKRIKKKEKIIKNKFLIAVRSTRNFAFCI